MIPNEIKETILTYVDINEKIKISKNFLCILFAR